MAILWFGSIGSAQPPNPKDNWGIPDDLLRQHVPNHRDRLKPPELTPEQFEHMNRRSWAKDYVILPIKLTLVAVSCALLQGVAELSIRTAAKWLLAGCGLVLLALLAILGIMVGDAVSSVVPMAVVNSTTLSVLVVLSAVGTVVAVGYAVQLLIPLATSARASTPSLPSYELAPACPQCLARAQFDGITCGNCNFGTNPPPSAS